MSDMTELFMRDPLELTNEDITKIIAHYREARTTFKAAPASVKGRKSPAQDRATSSLNISLEL